MAFRQPDFAFLRFMDRREGRIWHISALPIKWQGDEKYWGDRALNLFPYIARLTEGKYTLDGQTYHMDIHGFVKTSVLVPEEQKADRITLKLTQNEETLAQYPFDFIYRIRYELDGNRLGIVFSVTNSNDRTMYFGIGGHPGFFVPLEKGLSFEDYYLQFDEEKTPVRVGISPTCFVDGNDKEYPLAEGGRICLAHSLFDDDAIVLREMSKAVTIQSDKGTKAVRVEYPQMNYLGIWHMPHTDAPYVCIEPWSSLPDATFVGRELSQKAGVRRLAPGQSEELSYLTTINHREKEEKG